MTDGMPSPEDLQALAIEFDLSCQQRHEMGAEKYGPVNFLRVDSIEMAIEEVVDLANYARYTYIKLRLLQNALAKFNQVIDSELESLEGMDPRDGGPGAQ